MDLQRKNNPSLNYNELAYVRLSGSKDRDSYIQDCIRLGRVNVISTNGIVYSNCPVLNKDFSLIEFPEKVGDLGTAVILLNIFGSTIPVVLGTVPTLENYPYIQNEKQDVNFIEDENCAITIDKDPKNGTHSISIFGKKAGKSNFNISVGAIDGNAKCNIDVQGEMKTNVTKLSQINVEEELDINLKNKEKNDKFTKINWKRGTGLVVTDEFENFVSLKQAGSIIEVSKISIGNKNGGESLQKLLTDLIQTIETMTLMTPAGVTVAPPINEAQFIQIKNRIQQFMEMTK